MKKQENTSTAPQRRKPRRNSNTRKRVQRMIFILIGLGLVCYGGLVAFVYYAETHVPEPSDYDSIIVLGAQVLPDGSPSIQLRWRLDKAIEMYQAHPCPIVVCGGQGGDEPAPEGQIMRELLLADGLPPDHVYSDISSVNTMENIQNAWEILSELGCEKPLVVTSDYHLPRALAIARDAGLTPQGAGSPCKNEIGFWLKNHLREALSWVKYWGIKYVGLPL